MHMHMHLMMHSIKLRKMLGKQRANRHIKEQFKALIWKVSVLTVTGSVTTLSCYVLWIGTGATGWLYFDVLANCVVTSLMFQHNQSLYRRLCRPCVYRKKSEDATPTSPETSTATGTRQLPSRSPSTRMSIASPTISMTSNLPPPALTPASSNVHLHVPTVEHVMELEKVDSDSQGDDEDESPDIVFTAFPMP